MKKTTMKRILFIMLAMLPLAVFMSCGDDYENIDKTCIKNETTLDWHNAGVQFMDVDGKNVKYVEIGAVAKGDYRYVPIAADYFVVDFFDENRAKHISEKYYSNPFVDVSFLKQ